MSHHHLFSTINKDYKLFYFIVGIFAFIQLIKMMYTHNKFTLNTATQAHVYPKCTPMAAMLPTNSTGSRFSYANEEGLTFGRSQMTGADVSQSKRL